MKGNKVNITLVLAIITARDDKRPATCPVGAALQRWSAAKLVLAWTQQQLSGSVDPLRSESNRGGLSFLLPLYKETPVQYEKPQKDFTTLSESAVLEQRGERKWGTGTEKKRDNGSRRKKVVSRESRSPSEL